MPPPQAETTPAAAYAVPEHVQRAVATLKTINWRLVAVPFVLAGFLTLLALTVFPLLGTPVGLWYTTAGAGLVFAFLLWPKTLWKAITAVTLALWRVGKWIARTIRGAVVVTLKTIKAVVLGFIAWWKRRSMMDLVFLVLWLAVLVAAGTLYILDASFYGGVAPPSIPTWIFQAFGVVFRTFVIFGGLAIVWLKQSRAPRPLIFFTRMEETGWKRFIPVPQFQSPDSLWASGATMRTIQTLGLVVCVASAMGFVSEGNDFHARKARATTSAATVATESQAEKIGRLNKDKEGIRKDRDDAIAQVERSIQRIENDGVPGISPADNISIKNLQAEITGYQNVANAALKAKDDEINAAENATEDARSIAVEKSVEQPELAAVWQLPARYVTWLKGVWLRDGFSVLWVFLLEMIGSFGAQALYTLHIFIAKRRGLQAAGSIGGKTTSRRNRVKRKLQQIEDLRGEKQETAADMDEDLEDDDLDQDEDRNGRA